jgi:hypothetical protein
MTLNPQQTVDPNPLPETVVPQADPASTQGPDSHSLPTLSQVVGTPDDRDYKASYKGLNKRYEEDRRVWDSERQSLRNELDTIKTMLTPKADPVEPTEPVPVPPVTQSQGPSALEEAIQQKHAEQYRDLLIGEYTKPGGPAEGLPLNMFVENIKIVPPTTGADGKLDDSAQRQEIDGLVTSLKGLQGETKQKTAEALVTGQTPGSSPAAPAGEDGDTIYQEFQDIMQVYGSQEYLGLDKTEQARIESRYYELLESPHIEDRHEGDLAPTNTVAELQRSVRELSKQVTQMSGKNPLMNTQ